MTSTTRTYQCHRCGKRLSVWLYSQWTRERYCTDIDACAKRAKRTKREA